jgi:sugar lactone lactonase YvrE
MRTPRLLLVAALLVSACQPALLPASLAAPGTVTVRQRLQVRVALRFPAVAGGLKTQATTTDIHHVTLTLVRESDGVTVGQPATVLPPYTGTVTVAMAPVTAGTYRLKAEAFSSATDVVSITAGGARTSTNTITVSGQAVSYSTGTAFDLPMLPLAGADIDATITGSLGQNVAALVNATTGATVVAPFETANGTFRFKNVPDGSYSLVVSSRNGAGQSGRSRVSGPITVSGGGAVASGAFAVTLTSDLLPFARGTAASNVPATSVSLSGSLTTLAGGVLAVVDNIHQLIRRRDPVSGEITTVAGSGVTGFAGDGGPATAAAFLNPAFLTKDNAGNLFFFDSGNLRVRRIDAATGIITTILGTGITGTDGDGGPGTAAKSAFVQGLTTDAAGNLYIGDGSGRVRKWTAATGIVTTIAGTGVGGSGGDGGPATAAQLSSPSALAMDTGGNLYFCDTNNHKVRRIDPGGTITTVAGNGSPWGLGDGGPATAASLSTPQGVVVDGAGNLYITDTQHHRIRRVDVGSGVITTIAGDGSGGYSGDGGPAAAARIAWPRDMHWDSAGNLVFSDATNHRIRRIDLGTGIIATVAGNGYRSYSGDGRPAETAEFGNLTAVAADAAGNVYVADDTNHVVRRIAAGTGLVSTYAGTGTPGDTGVGGAAAAAELNAPVALAVDRLGNLYISDKGNSRVVKVAAGTQALTIVAGGGTAGYSGDGAAATAAQLDGPESLAVDGAGNLYVADTNNYVVRKVAADDGTITTICGNGVQGSTGEGGPALSASLHKNGKIAVTASGKLYVTDAVRAYVSTIDANGDLVAVAGTGTAGYSGDGADATAAQIGIPSGLAVDAAGNLYLGDPDAKRLRLVTAGSGIISTVAGDGTTGTGGFGGTSFTAPLPGVGGVTCGADGTVYLVAGSQIVRIF